jgi:hypothetical protein
MERTSRSSPSWETDEAVGEEEGDEAASRASQRRPVAFHPSGLRRCAPCSPRYKVAPPFDPGRRPTGASDSPPMAATGSHAHSLLVERGSGAQPVTAVGGVALGLSSRSL